MTQLEKVLYTAKTHTTGGRDGASRSSDGRLDVKFSSPGSTGNGTNPEQLFAAGWSACFEGAMGLAARKMKVRHEPFSVYMHFDEPHAGREVIFVEGRNNNNLLVHEAGFASLIGTLELEPTGSQAMAENRYPITKAGIQKMI